MESFGERALKIRKHSGLSQEAFAQKIGISSKQTVSNVEKGKQKKYTDEEINRIIDEYGVSKAWFILGEGEMLETEAKSNPSNTHEYDPSKFVAVPIMSAKAGAGSTGPAHYEVYTQGELMIDRILFRVLPNLKNVRAIEVDGDSMRPTLNEGDFVIIEENSAFSGEGIYVLQYDGVLLVKRLQPDFDGIEILSDNPNYKPRKFNPSDDQSPFHIVGKVILKVQR